ncbi:MAG: hypothetical protein ACPLXN_04260 [Sulfurihydrogenibium sp.]|uniref:hypothetical protein n=1 Tax=Sulfurihydrogenibium sp. TaxID=2053621 RepID=UPI003C7B3F29
MGLKETVAELLKKAYTDAKVNYIGLFIKGKVYEYRSTGINERVEKNFSKMIQKSLDINIAIKNFKAEFLFAENKSKDFSIFIYYITNDIAIGMLQTGKPNFSLLKVVSSDLAKSIAPLSKQLLEVYETELKGKEESEDQFLEKLPKKDTVNKNQNKVVEESLDSSEIEELEKVFTQDVKIDTKEEKKQVADEIQEPVEIKPDEIKIPDLMEILNLDQTNTQQNETQKEKSEEISIDKQPSLEEILKEDSKQDIKNIEIPISADIEEICSNIRKLYVKYIGPFGNFLLNKRKEEFFKNNPFNRESVLKFCSIIAEDIPDTKRKESFLKEVKEFFK